VPRHARPPQPPAAEAVTERTRVSSVELFFDLVYVFAINHSAAVVTSRAEVGVVRGGLILALLWWVWVGYAWLSNQVFMDRRFMQLTILAAVTVLFLVGAAIPEAFADVSGGFNGPLVLAGCYLAVRILQVVVLWYATARTAGSRRLLGMAAPAMTASLLLGCAALVPRWLPRHPFWLTAGPDVLWLLAILVEYGAGIILIRRWVVRSAALWSERHQLIVIVALGEAFIGLGLGGIEIPLSTVLMTASVLGIVIIAALWWAYFEVLAPAGEWALQRSEGAGRVALARDAYSLLHLPILAGIVLFAVGLGRALAFAAHLKETGTAARLDHISLGALYGGVILFLLGVLGFQWRVMGRVSQFRVAVTVLLAALLPVGATVPAYLAYGMLAAVAVSLVAVEFRRHTAVHHELRDLLATREH
jgi:low temperature requirement protein LtrA